MRVDTDLVATGNHHSAAQVVPPSVQAFCTQTTAYLPEPQTDAEFIEAMRDITQWHQQRSPWYRALLEQHNTHVESINSMADVLALPLVHANFFKQHEVLSVASNDIAVHLTSSGTTGQKSQMFFDAFSIGTARRMVDDVMLARGIVSDQPTNYLVNAYEPYEGLKVGTSNTNQYLMRYAPPADVFWSLRAAGPEKHEFDVFGAISALQTYAKDSKPTRIIGFPAFLHFTLQRMATLGMPSLQLPPGSAVIFGGGWKGHADQAISKDALHQSITQWLGIPSQNIVETFGSVEHSVPYVDCHQHHLHIPMWSRVVIRDVRSLEPVADGQPGFLSFVSPYITSVPAHNVVMGDLAVRHPAGSCSCGNPAPWFEVLGRAGTSSNKSCAAAAAQLLPTS